MKYTHSPLQQLTSMHTANTRGVHLKVQGFRGRECSLQAFIEEEMHKAVPKPACSVHTHALHTNSKKQEQMRSCFSHHCDLVKIT